MTKFVRTIFCNYMKRITLILAALTLLGTGLQAKELVCEIDDITTQFSWKLLDNGHDIIQKSYRIILHDNAGNKVWDSGRVTSDESISIRYNGPALQSDSDYSWTLRTWYSDGQSCKSGPHRFHTGLKNESDWGDARWIAFEHDREFEKGPAGKYIHSYTDQDRRMMANGTVIGDYVLPQFRKSFDIKSRPESATLYITDRKSVV